MTNDAIRLAIEKGGWGDSTYLDDWQSIEKDALLDPLFWQALERAMDWKWKAGETIPWILHWHRFIDHIAEGKDVDLFFKELLK